MRVMVAAILVASLMVPAHAQEQPYVPLDAELWAWLVRALGDVPMSLPAHNQVQQNVAAAQREAAKRASLAKAMKPADPVAKPSDPATVRDETPVH